MFNVEIKMYGKWRVLAQNVSQASADRIIAHGKSVAPTIPICKISV